MVQQIIYRSQPAIEVTALVLTALLDQARAFNEHRGITGVPLCTDDGFVQALEGDAAVLDNLMARISRDYRHRNVELLLDRTVADREFGDWSMAFAGDGWSDHQSGAADEVGSLRSRLAQTLANDVAGLRAEIGDMKQQARRRGAPTI